MSSAVKGARRTLAGLGWIIVILAGILSTGILTDQKGASATPELGLDLQGGQQLIMTAFTTDGSEIDSSDMKQAVEIIRKRVDASGTNEAEITTQGDRNIIVALPGTPDEATLDLVRKAAQLQFRPVIVQQLIDPNAIVIESSTSPTPSPSPSPSAEPSTSPSPSASAQGSDAAAEEVANVVTAAGTSATPSPSPSASPSPEPTDTPAATPADASDFAWVTAELIAEFEALDCSADSGNLAGVDSGDPEAGFVTCNADGSAKYILGPVELTGEDVATATAGPQTNTLGNALPGKYAVYLSLTTDGGKAFKAVTGRLATLESPRDQFGIVLDGVVLSAPFVEQAIGGDAVISGTFTRSESQQLANQLKFGALPFSLEVQSEQTIQATKGQTDLQHGIWAGLIGLGLVVVYTIFQYRALGLVTIGSLLISGLLTYLVITLLSWTIGYRLSLAGVTGLIVAIGITADSFIVYFERVKDELREGRSLQAAVNHAWPRARRTILASDAVSFLAALVLYALAVGGVRGFAFTLGLTTLIDLVVVIMFTHPVLALLARTKFFGDGHRLSGLDPRQLGRDTLYKGRGRALEPGATSALSIAERKAQKARGTAVAVEEKK